ncbi:MAG: AraC family transcriptional regulator [Cellvibrio sp. 79]|nr:MAG: AraC family transcriptional regulator [Cellvibrio sp. 79]
MIKFYRNVAIGSLVMVMVTAFIFYIGYKKSQLAVSLFPARDQGFVWKTSLEPEKPKGKTQLLLRNEVGNIEYDFFLDPAQQFPYIHYSVYFVDAIQSTLQVDLTSYQTISFKVICDPKNVLQFVLFSFDGRVTDLKNLVTRRVSSTAFSCTQRWSKVTIELDDLETPQWWLSKYGFEYSEKGYQLNKTMGFAWVNSLQSPTNTFSNVKLTEIQLSGSEPRYIYGSIVLCICLWILFLVWQLRRYTTALTLEIRARVKDDQPLIAYKKLSIEPQKDKEKDSLLRYMATEYTNHDLSLESAISSLNINRNKINDILKEELGLTFTTYLNKLRLTEAARLLTENTNVNVSEIAYAVGYNNVPYFNKLFKQEYGCAPKTFKTLYQSKDLLHLNDSNND